MRLCHIVPNVAHGPLSYSDLTSGGRGCTGSEQATLHLARAQAAMGHDVIVYVPTDNPGYVNGVQLIDIRAAWPRMRRADTSDVVVSWIGADPLRGLGPKPLKIHSLQINDWLINTADYAKYVDVFVAVTKSHQAHLLTETLAPVDMPWEIIPNGTAAEPVANARQPLRCAYLSSPDRGLHWLLAIWPEIRFAYPTAELHVYYEIQKWIDSATLTNSEVGNRARYVVERMPLLGRHGVFLHGAVSPQRVVAELSLSDVLLYPCDPVRYTEGFGVAVLDACMTGTVPVITDADALGEVYAESGAVVIRRGDTKHWIDEFLETAIKLLGNEEEKQTRRVAVQAFAQRYTWDRVAAEWQTMIEKRLYAKEAK